MRRLDQLLASLGHGSRREVTAMIRAGQVTLAGQPTTQADLRVDPSQVRIHGQPLEAPDGLLVLLHKPLGCVCSHNPAEGPLIYDLLPPHWRYRKPTITTVGRLDKDTSGLLLITDRGDWVHRFTSPKSLLEKVYDVTVDHPLQPSLIHTFASGTLTLKGEPHPCLPATLDIVDDLHARLTLTEGRYHQVRRMFASQGWHVTALHRSRFGQLTLNSLPIGHWRWLSGPDEISPTSAPLP